MAHRWVIMKAGSATFIGENVIVETFPVGLLACNATIVGDEETRDAIVVDGGDGVDDVLKRLKQLGLRARYLVHTHAHFDHIADVGRLREATRALALLHHDDLPIYHDQPRLVKLFGLAIRFRTLWHSTATWKMAFAYPSAR